MIKLQFKETEILGFNEFIEHLKCELDPEDKASILAMAPKLYALSKNKVFVIDAIHRELKNGINSFQSNNHYTEQSLLLSSNELFTIRLNSWSPPVPYGGDAKWDAKRQAYSLAHNHNFDLLTVGYWGPGYDTEIYKFDAAASIGYVGEKVNLEAQGMTRLSQTCVMLYEKSTDVHIQLPPDEFSMSLNLIPNSNSQLRMDQYEFDIPTKTISAHVGTTITSKIALLRIASIMGDDDTASILLDIARHHTQPRIRANACLAVGSMSEIYLEDAIAIAERDPHESARSHLVRSFKL